MVVRQAPVAAPGLEFDPVSILTRLGNKGRVTLEDICLSLSGVERDELLLQLSLHLPRLPGEESKDTPCVLGEAERLARRLSELRKNYWDLVPNKTTLDDSLSDYKCDFLPEGVAQPILERFHYLLS